MVTYDKNEKDLVIPSALGLAGMQDSVCGVTEQEVIEIVESAITDYDTEIQVDFEDIRENVSGNTNDIAALSAATEALEQRVDNISTSAITGEIEALSAATVDIRSDVNTLSGDTDSIRTDVAALSAQTSANTATIVAGFALLKGDVGALSARTSANTEDIATLSASTSANAESIAAVSGATTALTENLNALSGAAQETYSQIDDLWDAVNEKQDALEAGDGISLDSPNISVNAGKGLYFKEDGKMEVLLGPGLQYSGSTNALAAKIGEGLGFSGDTLVVSGISGGGAKVYVLNLMSQAELVDLYDELLTYQRSDDPDNPYYWYISSAYTPSDYKFYWYVPEGEADYGEQTFKGFAEVEFDKFDYSEWGLSILFGGTFCTNDNVVSTIKGYLNDDGGMAGWWITQVAPPENTGASFEITSAGTAVNFDTYNFNRAYGEPQKTLDYYRPAMSPIVVKDGDDTVGLGSVIASCFMPDGTYTDSSWIIRAVLEIIVGNSVYRIIGDSVASGSEEGWHVVDVSTVHTVNV